jgi:DNA-binding NarL/FixJ family response regulator
MVTVLVSESTIVLGALERCIQDEGTEIKKVRRLGQLRGTDDWSKVTVIFDLAHAERGINDLFTLGAANLARCVVLAREAEGLHVLAPLVGVVGAIILDTNSLEDIAQAARMVRNGLHVLPAQMKQMLARQPVAARQNHQATASLTERENSVLSLITQGCSNKVIARKLQISDSTVRVHVRSVLKKLGVQNRTQAALVVLDRRGKAPGKAQVESGPHVTSNAGRPTSTH